MATAALVDKATNSEFLTQPDWSVNTEIIDVLNGVPELCVAAHLPHLHLLSRLYVRRGVNDVSGTSPLILSLLQHSGHDWPGLRQADDG